MKLKVLSIIVIGLFLGSALVPNVTSIHTNSMEPLDESSCYGFIVPIVKLENESLSNDINCRIYNMINDFLREEITVYWTAENCTTSILKINDTEEQDMFFEKGTFIISFSNNESINIKISNIVCDYNQSSEIEPDTKSVPVYFLTEENAINSFKLTRVKIARYHGSKTIDVQYLLWLNLVQTGFLDFDLITPENTKTKLNKENFNVMFWPGGNNDLGNINWRKATIEEIINGVPGSIRKFVNSGGSYFGACYGSLKASRLPFYKLLKTYSFPPLRIINIVTYLSDKSFPVVCEQKIQDTDHPITYGLNNSIIDYYGGGPKIIFKGKDVKVISEIHNTNQYVDGSSSWVTSDYGDGKVVVFTSHPEIVDYFDGIYVGKKVIANTLFYTTAKVSLDYNINTSVSTDSIVSIFNNTINITNHEEIDQFGTLKEGVDSIINLTRNQRNKMYQLLDLINNNFEDLENENFVKFQNRYIQRISNNINLSYDIIEKINETIEKIEMIYSLISQNENFENEKKSLKNYFDKKIDEINECILNSISRAECIDDNINSLIDNKSFFKDKIKNEIKKDTYEVSKIYSTLYVYVVQIYFESLKFLRHSWYDYESSIILDL